MDGKGDLERGLLGDKATKSKGVPDVLCSEADKGAIVAVAITVVLLASLGFLIYLGVVVLNRINDDIHDLRQTTQQLLANVGYLCGRFGGCPDVWYR